MAKQLLKRVLHPVNGLHSSLNLSVRPTSTLHYIQIRAKDPTFEKYMKNYRNLNKVIAVKDLILANTTVSLPAVSVDFLERLAHKIELNCCAPEFLRRYPHVFKVYHNHSKGMDYCKLTDEAAEILQLEADAIRESLPLVVDKLVRILSMSVTKSLPLRVICGVQRALGLPDDFEESVIARNPHLFALSPGKKRDTVVLYLVQSYPSGHFTASVEDWRVMECCKKDTKLDRTVLQYSFKLEFPPGMKLEDVYKYKIKKWQGRPYVGPYEVKKVLRRMKSGGLSPEKRSVAILHEFMSLTVEKMIEAQKVCPFRKWFGIDFEVRDIFLDHPGIFYLSTKGRKHTIFLREAYKWGRLINPNPVYEARMKLLYLVSCGRRGSLPKDSIPDPDAGIQHGKDDKVSLSSDFEDLDED